MIIGPDLVWRDGRFVTVRSANKDPELKNPNKVSDSRFDLLVRNVYKVLLTRGMIGTAIYATDPETQNALRSLIRTPTRIESHFVVNRRVTISTDQEHNPVGADR